MAIALLRHSRQMLIEASIYDKNVITWEHYSSDQNSPLECVSDYFPCGDKKESLLVINPLVPSDTSKQSRPRSTPQNAASD